MQYIYLSVGCVAGYILMRIGSKRKRRILKAIGWLIMIGCCIAMLVIRYVYKI